MKQNTTIRATHVLVKGAMEYAFETTKIKKNWAAKVVLPQDTENEGEVRALEINGYIKFFAQLKKDSKIFYMFAFILSKTGARVNEAIALDRSDIIFTAQGAKVVIKKTFIPIAGEVQERTKTPTSKRIVPISKKNASLLKEYMFECKNKKNDAPLFQTRKGTRLTPRNVLRQLKNTGAKVGLGWVNNHTMRHTFASHLFALKVDIKIISRYLGHKKVSTTYDLYVHIFDKYKQIDEPIDLLDTITEPANTEQTKTSAT